MKMQASDRNRETLKMMFWVWFQFILVQWNMVNVFAAWPSPQPASIQLLGLFPDGENISDTTELSIHSRAMFKAAVLLSQQYNITVDGELIQWQATQTGGEMIDALSDACQAVSTAKTLGIVGPASSREAPLIAAFAKKVGIPVVSYGATDPDLSETNHYPAFHRSVPSDNAAASAIAKLFFRFNWTSCVIIHQNDAYGNGGAKIINKIFANSGLLVNGLLLFDITTSAFRGDLKQFLLNSATRIVVVWIEPRYASVLVQRALDADVVGPHFIWLVSASIPLDSFNATFYPKLIGLLAVEPVTGTVVGAPINTTLFDAALNIWQQYEPESFPGSAQVNYYASFAFDAAWSLIQSLRRLCPSTIPSAPACSFVTGSTFCFDRRFEQGSALMDIVSTTEFLGISGPVRFSVNGTDRADGSYFQVKNVQLFLNSLDFVPVLDYSDSGRWTMHKQGNVVIWPGISLNPPTGRAVLEGVRLRIGIIESQPFTIVTRTLDASGESIIKYTGYIPDLIELLRSRLKFIPDIQLASFNQTYAGLIRAVASGDYDIVIGDVTVTAFRRELVGFSNAIFDNSLRIIMRKTTDVNVDLLSFLKPFSRNLWFLLLTACFFAGILVCLVERRDNVALRNRSIIAQLTLSIWYSFGNIVGFGVEFGASTAAGRLLTVGLYILSLILVASYTANLASDLTISKAKSMITGMHDLKNGKVPNNRIGIRPGTAGEEYYLREISGGNPNYYPLKSRKDLYESLLANIIDASFIDSGVAEYVTNNIYCNLTVVREDFDKSVFAIVRSKEWLYAQDLDVAILSLRELGTLDYLRQKWFQSKMCPDATEVSTAIGIDATAGLFLTFGLIVILSLLLLAWTERHTVKDRVRGLLGGKSRVKDWKCSAETSSRDSQSTSSDDTRL